MEKGRVRLLEQLESDRYAVSAAAAARLALLGDRRDFTAIWRSVKRDCAWEHVPREKIEALSRLAGGEEIDFLLAEAASYREDACAAESDDLYDECHRILRSLAGVLAAMDPPALHALQRMLEASDPMARSAAAAALSKIPDPAAGELLLRRVEHEPDGGIQYVLLSGLRGRAPAGAFEVLRAVTESTGGSNLRLRVAAAAEALGATGDERTLSVLQKLLETGSDATMRAGAVRGLAAAGGDAARPLLVQALEDADASVRAAAAEALGEMAPAEDVLPILRLLALQDPSSTVRKGAVKGLGRLGTTEAGRILEAALQDGNGFVRCDAVRSMAAIGSPEMRQVLEGVLAHEDEAVRNAAAEVLKGRRA